MATDRQRETRGENVVKAQTHSKEMSHSQLARSQPGGNKRGSPGSTGKGDYYHIELRPKSGFKTFRTQDVGEPGHIQRVAGRRKSGSWATVKWLISKDDAHVSSGRLIGDTKAVRDLLDRLGSDAIRQNGDRFKAKDRPNIAEKDKPTPDQRLARSRNIKKAQAARRKSSNVR